MEKREFFPQKKNHKNPKKRNPKSPLAPHGGPANRDPRLLKTPPRGFPGFPRTKAGPSGGKGKGSPKVGPAHALPAFKGGGGLGIGGPGSPAGPGWGPGPKGGGEGGPRLLSARKNRREEGGKKRKGF